MPQDQARPPLEHPSLSRAGDLIWQRYRDGLAAPPPAWNAVLEQLFAHRSVRAYLADALPAGTLELLIGAAQSAASSSNLQAYSVLAVEDPARKAELARLAGNQAHIAQAPLFLIFLADLARLEQIGAMRSSELEGIQYLELLLVGIVDAALAAQNAVIAAESLGLGTVYIGAIRNDIAAVAELLKLPPQVMPVFGLTIGRPDPSVRTDIKPRLPQSVALHREVYSSAGLADGVARYEAAMTLFQADQALPPDSWRDKIVARVGTPKALAGRHRIIETLKRLGFGLR